MTRGGTPRPLWFHAERYAAWLERARIGDTDMIAGLGVDVRYDTHGTAHTPTCADLGAAPAHQRQQLVALGELARPATDSPIAHSCCARTGNWETAAPEWNQRIDDSVETLHALEWLHRVADNGDSGQDATSAVIRNRLDQARAARNANALRAGVLAAGSGLAPFADQAARHATDIGRLGNLIVERIRAAHGDEHGTRDTIWAIHWRTLDSIHRAEVARVLACSVGGQLDGHLIVWSSAQLLDRATSHNGWSQRAHSEQRPDEHQLAVLDAVWDGTPRTFTSAWEAARLLAD